MRKPSLSIIGCGKMGTFLGKLLKNSVNIHALVTRSQKNDQFIMSLLGQKPIMLENIISSDFYLIAVNDDSLEETIYKLANNPVVLPGQTAFHVSGSFDEKILKPLQDKGLHVCCIHPIIAVPNPFLEPVPFYIDIMGESQAIWHVKKLFSDVDVTFVSLHIKDKTLYHTAIVMASNFVLCLLEISAELLKKNGVNDPMPILISLGKGTLQNLEQLGFKETLSGPAVRLDEELLKRHMQYLYQLEPTLGELYRILSVILIEMKIESRLGKILSVMKKASEEMKEG